MNYWLNSIIIVAILIGGFTTLSWATNGWTTWTAESARRYNIQKNQPQLANFLTLNENNTYHHFYDFDDDIILVDFIFTRCPTVCIAMGYEFKALQHTLAMTPYHDRIQFLSISFDHEYDGPTELKHYLARYSSDHNNWSALKVPEHNELKALLQQLGVIAIPDKELGYVHNTAIYMVKNRKVIGVFDYENRREIMTTLLRELQG